VWQDGKSTTMGSFHALSFFAPDINLCRDPRWGRCLEVPSECPLLTGEYAMSFVRAMQQKSTDGKYFEVLANAKHFSSYDVEKGSDNSPGQTGGGAKYDRGSFNAYMSRQDMIETYWPQFRAAVQGRSARRHDVLVQRRLRRRSERRAVRSVVCKWRLQQPSAQAEARLHRHDRQRLRSDRRR